MDIEASILDSVLTEAASVNRIMITANLNRKAAKAHLQGMISSGLVHLLRGSEGYSLYSSTEKGIRWLKRYKSLVEDDGHGRKGKFMEGRDF